MEIRVFLVKWLHKMPWLYIMECNYKSENSTWIPWESHGRKVIGVPGVCNGRVRVSIVNRHECMLDIWARIPGLSNGMTEGLEICSFAHRSLAHLLNSLKSNERLLAISSDSSRQMSDCERIAQVAQDKSAIASKSLRLLMTNEQPWGIRSGRSW